MEFTGKTVEEAISLGLSELGISEEQADISVVEEPVKGLFGKVKKNAVVEISKKPEGVQKAVEFIQKVIDMLDITAKATFNGDEDQAVINLIAENSSSVIGYRGEVLDALQTLAGAVANIGKKEYKKVVVDCENYREKREETLINLAHKLEAKATDMKREVILEPMVAYERRIIHTALSESQTVTTRSDGKDPNRYVVIVPNELDEFSKPYNASRNNDKKDRKGKKGSKFDKKDKGFKKGGFKGSRDKKVDGAKKKNTITFGTYLGNSLKDKE